MATQKTSHLERTAAEPRDRELYDVRLGRIDQVNERVRLFRLELTSGPVTFRPGQWLDTYVPDTPKAGGFTITSPPSAASSAHPTPYLELAVQESPGNAPAAWLWRPQDEILGSQLKVRIGGSFVFPPPGVVAPDELGRVVFVAGGVGINPLASMLSYIGDNADAFAGLDVRVAYGSRVPCQGVGKIVFLDRITRLFGQGRLRGSIGLFVTGSSEQQLEYGRRVMNGAEVDVQGRRLSVEDVAALVGAQGQDAGSTFVYMCGPPTMTDECTAALASKDGNGLAMGPDKIITEKWW